jgi:site-specific recombinase XerD
MATFHLELDKRVKLKNSRYNLSVRIGMGNDNMYLKIVPMTVEQYEKVFQKKTMDMKSVKLRRDCQEFLSRGETIFADMKHFDKRKYRRLVYGIKDENDEIKDSLLLKDLIKIYLESNHRRKLKTKCMYQTALNSFLEFRPGLSITDINPDFLMDFEISKREGGYSQATISTYMRHLRSLINHFTYVDKRIPNDFIYPFGQGGYTIKNYRISKQVMSNEEIQKVIDFKDFQNKDQEYARDIWLILYRANGMNYADFFRLKWFNIKGKYIVFTRLKTENTRRNNVKDIVVPLKPELKQLIDKVGVKSSPFILGILEEGYDEKTFRNKKDWQQQKINKSLKYISEKLELSVNLRLKTSRDSYATTLKRSGKSRDEIGEMLGHSTSQVTDYYLASLDMDKTWKINEGLL